MTRPEPMAAGVSPPAAFATALFGRTAREDLAPFSPADLASLAHLAWQHLLGRRPSGMPAMSLVSPDDPGLARRTILMVVNDDMPFLLDSTLAEFAARGLEVRLVAHPILGVRRDGDGQVLDVAFEPNGGDGPRESFIYIHLERLDEAQAASLREALDRIYQDVRVCVADWQAMRRRVAAAIADYRTRPPALPADEIAEAVQLLEWLEADNFTLLGVREYRLAEIVDGASGFDPVGRSGLGILRDPSVKVLRRGLDLVSVSPEVLEFLREPQALVITKANVLSRVHRRVHMDYIGIKLFDPEHRLAGELRVVGLFTSSAYTRPVASIPYLRHKAAGVTKHFALDPESHSGKALAMVVETFPRDELFQIDLPTLIEFVAEIASLYERPRLRVLSRVDRFDRFVSILTFVPRDRFDTRVSQRIGQLLAQMFDGRISAVYPYYPDGPFVRIHYIVGRYGGATPRVSREVLESAVAGIVRTWEDGFKDALAALPDASRARAYLGAFSLGYRESFTPAEALADVDLLDRLSATQPHAGTFRRRPGDPPERVALDIFSLGRQMPLSERVPVLEHLGFRVVSEQTFDIAPPGRAETIWLHDMTLERASGGGIDLARLQLPLERSFAAVLSGHAESDGFNALTLDVGMDWRDIVLLRTLSRYLRQAGIAFSQSYMWQVLVRNAPVTRRIVDLFHQRFDPSLGDTADRRDGEQAILADIESLLARVASLDEDRILRRFVNVVQASLRTNFFQNETGDLPPCVALKIESRRIDDLPLPRPVYEITVYSPEVEGIHLRFGQVARGGIRWSDRPQDFRTEVLGLVKAQQVKNAVIVPVGAKGGFVAKQLPPPGERDAWMAAGISAYKAFIGTLLDLTDTIQGERVVPPARMLRYDGDDPYLVVAADKGTATFSDIANGLATDHGFWLDDAFASGGSAGFDHKKMGITARGAWEAVKRHFREMDVDILTAPFTVAGVGDMSGDVFGNGMLLSPRIRLIAAFDHRDIFIDPNPDEALAVAERARLFALPRSSWQDYDRTRLSPGGGIYPRSAKEIVLSPQAQESLGIGTERLSPQDLLRAILRSPVDLLWFGGIGTYVRATQESDESVGDRTNDPIRVTATSLRCKVLGEGANLGVTSRGRIEAALRGIRLNSDAIDNSAGVNTSDMEVNLKIALSVVERAGRLTREARNQLLSDMTANVAALVLRNNDRQTLALSLAERRAIEDAGFAVRLMQSLERAGRLDRAVEFLPSDAEVAARVRTGQGLTRPELSILLAYAKLALKDELRASDVPDDPGVQGELAGYFPTLMNERFPDAIAGHRLRREIISTSLANAIIDHGGPMLVTRMVEETGAAVAAVARAFVVVRAAYGLSEIEAEIDALDTRIAGQLQLDLYALLQSVVVSRIAWMLRNLDLSKLGTMPQRFRTAVEALTFRLPSLVPAVTADAMRAQAQALVAKGVPESLATRMAALPGLLAVPDIQIVAEETGRELADVARVFFALDARLGLDALTSRFGEVKVSDHYDRLALDRARDTIEVARRRISAQAVTLGEVGTDDPLAGWFARHDAQAQRIVSMVTDIGQTGLGVSRLTVAASLLADLARA